MSKCQSAILVWGDEEYEKVQQTTVNSMNVRYFSFQSRQISMLGAQHFHELAF